jgi:Holliday junction resolvase-like predicted endonuclease
VNTAKKGRRTEHRSRRLLEAAGYRVIRSAGSLGAWDMIGVRGVDLVLVQVRSNRPPAAREARTLADYPAPPGCRKAVHVWQDGRPLPEGRGVGA